MLDRNTCSIRIKTVDTYRSHSLDLFLSKFPKLIDHMDQRISPIPELGIDDLTLFPIVAKVPCDGPESRGAHIVGLGHDNRGIMLKLGF